MDEDEKDAQRHVDRSAFVYKIVSTLAIAALSAGIMWAASTITSSSDKIIRIEKDVEYIFKQMAIDRGDIKELQRAPDPRR